MINYEDHEESSLGRYVRGLRARGLGESNCGGGCLTLEYCDEATNTCKAIPTYNPQGCIVYDVNGGPQLCGAGETCDFDQHVCLPTISGGFSGYASTIPPYNFESVQDCNGACGPWESCVNHSCVHTDFAAVCDAARQVLCRAGGGAWCTASCATIQNKIVGDCTLWGSYSQIGIAARCQGTNWVGSCPKPVGVCAPYSTKYEYWSDASLACWSARSVLATKDPKWAAFECGYIQQQLLTDCTLHSLSNHYDLEAGCDNGTWRGACPNPGCCPPLTTFNAQTHTCTPLAPCPPTCPEKTACEHDVAGGAHCRDIAGHQNLCAGLCPDNWYCDYTVRACRTKLAGYPCGGFCPSGQSCQSDGATCAPTTAPPCTTAGVTCLNSHCDRASGSCVATCPSGTTLNAATNICESSTTGECGVTGCPHGQGCNYATGQCQSEDCRTNGCTGTDTCNTVTSKCEPSPGCNTCNNLCPPDAPCNPATCQCEIGTLGVPEPSPLLAILGIGALLGGLAYLHSKGQL